MASNVARYYLAHPDEVPSGESREQRVAGELLSADRNRNLALISGTGSILFVLGGVALFVSGGRKGRSAPAPESGSGKIPIERFEAMGHRMSGGMSVALARPLEVQYKKTYTILFVSVMVFFAGISLLMIAVNGFTSVTVLLLGLNVSLLLLLYYLQSRARRKSASFFDLVGVTRRDNQRFDWNAFKGVDYVMAIKPRSGKEYLWRIELVFNNGEVWIIPLRIKNLDEISNFVATLPGSHQKRITS